MVVGDAQRLRFRTHSTMAELQRDLLNKRQVEVSERRMKWKGQQGRAHRAL